MSPYYDSMIAKIIVHGRDRQEAIARMRRTLEMTVVDGIKTSIPLHLKILADPDFIGRTPGHLVHGALRGRQEERQRRSRRSRLLPPLSDPRRRSVPHRGLEPRELAEAFLAGGARILQLRDKSRSASVRLALAEDLVRLAHAAGARLIVNDRADIARLAGADGVHVGQDDLSVDEVRLVLGPDAIVGLSTHDDAQMAAAARTTATYIAVGPIYGTATKDTGYAARGLDLVRLAATTGKPVVAIGGITLERAPEVLEAGATSVAVISDLVSSGDPERRVRQVPGAADAMTPHRTCIICPPTDRI